MKVYAFASVDYPGAAESQVFESDGATAVGGFTFDPLSASPSGTTFTFTGGVYQIFTVPSSTASNATGINGAGLIVGAYRDLSGVRRGFANNGGTFSNVDFPGARSTGAFGVNDAEQIVGDYFDGAGDIVGSWGMQREPTAFCSRPAYSPPSPFRSPPTPPSSVSATPGRSPAFRGRRATFLTRIKKEGSVAGFCIDALGGIHGLTGK